MNLTNEEKQYLNSLTTVNSKKSYLQNLAIKLWASQKIGCIEAFTSFGKSHIINTVVSLFHRQKPDYTIAIIVPSITLREDILNSLEQNNLKADVYVINTLAVQVVKKEQQKHYDLVIADELHRLCGESSVYFSEIIPNITYKYFLGLSATLSKEDKNYLAQYNIPTVFNINNEEAIKYGLIPDYSIFNIAVNMTEQEKKEYIAIQKSYENIVSLFARYNVNNPTAAITACLSDKTKKVKFEGIIDYSINHAKRINEVLELQNEGVVIGCALKWRNIQNKRRLFLNSCINSVKATHYILKNIITDKQVLVFCSSIDICNLLQKQFDDSVAFHSKISKAKREKNKQSFANGDVRIMFCVNSGKEGLNFVSLEYIIRQGFTSKERDTTQILGRGLRWDKNNLNKSSLLIHVYVEDFIDEFGNTQYSQMKKWLQNSLRGRSFVEWGNIEELKQLLK